MALWDKYKINSLPEEQRAEVLKAHFHEMEETQRSKINSSGHQTVKGLAVVALALVFFFLGLFGYWCVQEWKEVKIKGMTPMVCPPPPAVTCPVQAFDIKVTPAA